jgi:hypothetical protein
MDLVEQERAGVHRGTVIPQLPSPRPNTKIGADCAGQAALERG